MPHCAKERTGLHFDVMNKIFASLLLTMLLAAPLAFAESHLSPHFPPGATDLVPMERPKLESFPRLHYKEVTQATEPKSVLDYPSPAPITFIESEYVIDWSSDQPKLRWLIIAQPKTAKE